MSTLLASTRCSVWVWVWVWTNHKSNLRSKRTLLSKFCTASMLYAILCYASANNKLKWSSCCTLHGALQLQRSPNQLLVIEIETVLVFVKTCVLCVCVERGAFALGDWDLSLCWCGHNTRSILTNPVPVPHCYCSWYLASTRMVLSTHHLCIIYLLCPLHRIPICIKWKVIVINYK